MAGKKKQGLSGLKDTPGGWKREDRQSAARLFFEPISIDAENVLTVIYMLRSPEGNVVLRAVASLERFGKKATENLELLVSSGIFDYILPLVQHEDYLVRRFAQKLVALLSALHDFRHQLLAGDITISIFVTILEKEEDAVMHEYSSLTLAHLSSECSAAGKILQIDGCVDVLFLRLSSPDPDVQNNCLQTMRNLLNELDGVQYFLFSSHFDLKRMMELVLCSYPVIQIAALGVIDQLMSWSMDNRILSAFRDSSGTEVIIGVVENEQWIELHEPALDIMLKVVDNPIIWEYIHQSGCLQRLALLLDFYEENSYSEKLLGILARASQTEGGRMALQANNVGLKFGEYLQKEWNGFQEPACLGLANMAQHPPTLNSIMSTKPIPRLLGIVTNPEKGWKLRKMAAYALNKLSHEDRRAVEELMQENRFEQLLPLLTGDGVVPVEAVLEILQIFIGITASENFRDIVTNENVIKAILNLIENAQEPYQKPVRVQVAALECLSGFLIEDGGCSICNALDGACKLIGCLKSKYNSIRQWAALIITQMSKNVDFVKSFIRLQGLKWMMDSKEMRYSAPSWESAIDAIFRAYLPAKFALTGCPAGRLDLHDLTQESFYILRCPGKPFFILEDLFEILASPAYPVYVANFSLCTTNSKECISLRSSRSSTPTGLLVANKKENQHQERGTPKDAARGSRNIVEDASWDGTHFSYDTCDNFGFSTASLKSFASFPTDPYLPEYLLRLKAKLLKETECKDTRWLGLHPKLIRERAKILADFVAEEMSGPEPDPICKDHLLQMHVHDIRSELGTNVIPIGHVRIGSYLERAFLFKVLADRIGLPCAFVRGSFSRAWVEIAIPAINVYDAMETKQTQTTFPKTPPPSLRSNVTSDGYVSSEEDVRNEIISQQEITQQREFSFSPVNMIFANAFPSKLLKANAIVDLIHEPGKILPLQSYEADEYRGNFLYLNCSKKTKGQ